MLTTALLIGIDLQRSIKKPEPLWTATASDPETANQP